MVNSVHLMQVSIVQRLEHSNAMAAANAVIDCSPSAIIDFTGRVRKLLHLMTAGAQWGQMCPVGHAVEKKAGIWQP